MQPESIAADAQAQRLMEGVLDEFEALLTGRRLVVFRARMRAIDPPLQRELAAQLGVSVRTIKADEAEVRRRLSEFAAGRRAQLMEVLS